MRPETETGLYLVAALSMLCVFAMAPVLHWAHSDGEGQNLGPSLLMWRIALGVSAVLGGGSIILFEMWLDAVLKATLL